MNSPDFVICFDRDYTVSTFPKPGCEMVPVSWVEELGSSFENIDVWAIGNQKLCDEAGIPGLEELTEKWANETIENPDESVKQPDYRLGIRADRVKVLERVHELYNSKFSSPSTQFIIVDDINMQDVGGWTYYKPWDFVDAIQNDNLPSQFPSLGEDN